MSEAALTCGIVAHYHDVAIWTHAHPCGMRGVWLQAADGQESAIKSQHSLNLTIPILQLHSFCTDGGHRVPRHHAPTIVNATTHRHPRLLAQASTGSGKFRNRAAFSPRI